MTVGIPTFRFLGPRNLLAFGAVFGLYTGLALRNPALVFVGCVCATTLCQAVWQALRTLLGVEVTRSHPPRAFEGDAAPVELALTAEGAGARSLILLRDNFPPASDSRITHLVERPLRRSERVLVRYAGRCDHRRGLYVVGPVTLEGYDDLGLVRRRVEAEALTELVVCPTAAGLRMTTVLGDGTLAHVGLETKRSPGQSEEFIGLREYRPGDARNAIHWRSVARTGELMIKEFQEEIRTDVTLFVDLGRMGLTGIGDQTTGEYAIKAAAALARRAIERSHAVQAFIASERGIERIPLGAGPGRLLLILDRLALLRPGGDHDFASLVRETIPTLARGGTAIVIQGATTLDFDAAAAILARMRARSILPLFALVDDRQFIKLLREHEIRHAEAAATEEIARFLTLLGARVHIIGKAESPIEGIARDLERPVLAGD